MKKVLLIAMAFIGIYANAAMTVKAIPQSPLCNGASTGSIALIIDGGASPYSFVWSSGQTTSSITSIPAGSYTVSVTDNVGLVSSATIVLAEPNALLLSAFAINVSQHGGNDGSINLSPRGGTFDYSFAWSNGEVTEDISNLIAGTYTVTVTDGFGCQATKSKTVYEPSHPQFSTATPQSPNADRGSSEVAGITETNKVDVSVYPNPTADFINVKMESTNELQVSVINNNGQVVMLEKFNTSNAKLNVSNLPNGNYIVQVKTNNTTTNRNVVIVK